MDPRVPNIPTGLPDEPDPLDPEPNVDVLDPGMSQDRGQSDNDAESILAPGFGNAEPEPAF
jgi:hypothetical protein